MFNNYDTIFWTFLMLQKKKKKQEIVNDDDDFIGFNFSK